MIDKEGLYFGKRGEPTEESFQKLNLFSISSVIIKIRRRSAFYNEVTTVKE